MLYQDQLILKLITYLKEQIHGYLCLVFWNGGILATPSLSAPSQSFGEPPICSIGSSLPLLCCCIHPGIAVVPWTSSVSHILSMSRRTVSNVSSFSTRKSWRLQSALFKRSLNRKAYYVKEYLREKTKRVKKSQNLQIYRMVKTYGKVSDIFDTVRNDSLILNPTLHGGIESIMSDFMFQFGVVSLEPI